MLLYKNGKIIDAVEGAKAPNKEEIKEILEDLDNYELLRIWNEFANYDTVFTSEEFDEICSGMTPTEIAMKSFYGDFNPNHDFWTFNGYENFKSSDYLTDLIYLDDLADDICDNYNTYDSDELEEYFESLEENEEE